MEKKPKEDGIPLTRNISLHISSIINQRIENILSPDETTESWVTRAINYYLTDREGLSVRRNIREYVAQLHTKVSILGTKCDNQAEEISILREEKAELQRKIKIERSRANTSEAQSQKAMEKVIHLQNDFKEKQLSYIDTDMRLEKLKKAEEILRSTEEELREKLEQERPLTEREKWVEELGKDLERAMSIVLRAIPKETEKAA